MTLNQVYGVATSDEQQQSVDKIELTQNQVYGAAMTDEAKIELTQNQVYGAAMTDETKIELTQNQVYGISQRGTQTATEKIISHDEDPYYDDIL